MRQGDSFLRGLLQENRDEDPWILVEEAEHVDVCTAIAERLGRTGQIHAVDRTRLAALANPGVLFYSGPDIGAEAFNRTCFAHRSWSLCGITHTTCTAQLMDSIVAFHAARMHLWDAVICTSEAVLANVQQLLAAQDAYLRERLGSTRGLSPSCR